MAQEYTITKVSEQEPKKYEGKFGVTYYIKVMLDGHDKPVQIGKKAPDALKEGYKVYGTIESTDFPEDKFKSEKKPDAGYGSKGNFTPRDDDRIVAQWAIGQAVQIEVATNGDKGKMANIENYAKELYAMVDRVKGGDPKAPAPTTSSRGYEKAKEVRAKLGDPDIDPEMQSLIDALPSEEEVADQPFDF